MHREKLTSNFTRLLLDFPSEWMQLVNLLANIAKSSKLPLWIEPKFAITSKFTRKPQYLVNLLANER